MSDYLSVGVNPPPLNKKIIVKKSDFVFDDGAKIVMLKGEEASLDYHLLGLVCDGFDLWRIV